MLGSGLGAGGVEGRGGTDWRGICDGRSAVDGAVGAVVVDGAPEGGNG